jgi:pyruvate dehydrogenase E2 component (dihydrolipoamide acetyltransferase)
MAEYIVMPKLGFDMREGVLNNWLKSVGDSIDKGEVIAEIESDKATLELEAQVGGTLLHLIHDPGDVVPVGANMAVVGEPDEDISSMVNGSAETQSEDEKEPDVQEAPDESTAKPEDKPAKPAATGKSQEHDETYPNGVRATPVARRIAEEHDIDLLQVKGTGPEGRIRKTDVEDFLAAPKETAKETDDTEAAAPVSMPTEGPDTTEEPTTRLRQAIARRMIESKTTVPHFYVTNEIDMGPALALRKQVNETLPDDQKVSVNDLIVKAAALAIREFPNLNAAYAGDKIIRHKRIHIGSAVAVEGGLLTVVQKDTDVTTLSKIAADHKAMIARAREGKIRPDDVEGSTFTVSNLGFYDVDHFIAIINPPEAAILSVGSAREVPVVVDGELAIGTRMKATISADHRVTDGAEAAQFMQQFKAFLEQPLRLLL